MVGGVVLYPRVTQILSAPAKPSPAEDYARGKELFDAGKYDDALARFDRAVSAEPKNAAYKFARGRARLRLGGDVRGALGDLAEVLDADRNDPRREEAVAYCQLLLDQFTPALHHLSAAETLGAKSPALHNNRAYAHIRLNGGPEDWGQARENLEKALKEDSDCVPARYNRALFALNMWFFERRPGKK